MKAAFVSLLGIIAIGASADEIITTGIPGANVQYGSISTQLTFATTGLPSVSSILNPPHSADTRTTGIYAQPTGINSVGSTYVPYLPDESTAISSSNFSSSSTTTEYAGGAAGATNTTTTETPMAVEAATAMIIKRQVPIRNDSLIYYDPVDIAYATGVVASGTGGTVLVEYFRQPVGTGAQIATPAGTGILNSTNGVPKLVPSGVALYPAPGVQRRQVTPPAVNGNGYGPVAAPTITSTVALLPDGQGPPLTSPTLDSPANQLAGGAGSVGGLDPAGGVGPTEQPVLIPSPDGPIPAVLGPDGQPIPIHPSSGVTPPSITSGAIQAGAYAPTTNCTQDTLPTHIAIPANDTTSVVPVTPASMNVAAGSGLPTVATFALVLCGAVAALVV